MLRLDTEEGDLEYAEEQLQHLIEQGELDLETIERVAQGPPPPGTSSTEAVQAGALLLGPGGSGALLPVPAALVQDWLNRRRSESR
ncbi:hypothetical protein GCM10010271_08440 [Streptomyces kurssanovii]|nr:hypothetical protein GCM10010271_08440 [Streptomyces kurssanovii]